MTHESVKLDFARFGRRSRNLLVQHQDNCYPDPAGYCQCLQPEAPPSEADLICSDTVVPGRHKPVIDLDIPCRLVPSGTFGNFHLYIDKALDSEVYFKLLDAMADAGVVERGYANASRERGYSAVRHPDRPKQKSVQL